MCLTIDLNCGKRSCILIVIQWITAALRLINISVQLVLAVEEEDDKLPGGWPKYYHSIAKIYRVIIIMDSGYML